MVTVSQQDVHIRAFPAVQVLTERLWKGDNKQVPYKAFEALCKEMPEAPGINLSGKISPNKDVALTVPGKELLFTGKDTVQTALQEVGYPYAVNSKSVRTKRRISAVCCLKALMPRYIQTGRIRGGLPSLATVTHLCLILIVFRPADGLPSASEEITRALPCMWTVNCRSVWRAEP